ncbi:hypothetical protein SLA2020_506320 [Shorea laevis]
MAKQSLAFIFFALACFLLHTNASGASIGTNQVTEQSWCIVKPSMDIDQLQKNIDYCCTQAENNCGTIQPGAPCYNPNNLVSDASVVMNFYFQKSGNQHSACYFNGSGLIIQEDPSVGACTYPAN